MINVTFSTDKNTVKPEEAINLYVKLNWGNRSQYSVETMKPALMNCSFIISARNNKDELIGLTRCLSDGFIHTTVADIVVHPDYQNNRIGQKMIALVKKKYKNTGIFIDCEKENKGLFEKCGFKKRDMLVFSKKFS